MKYKIEYETNDLEEMQEILKVIRKFNPKFDVEVYNGK